MQRYILKNRLLGICIFGCSLVMFSCVLSCEINADVFVLLNTYYEGDKFWSHSVSGFGTCAKLCMRMTKCESFNFDLSSRDCDLNSDLLENNPHLGKSKRRSVYSRIKDWPRQLDLKCYRRQCKRDEVCIPDESTKVPMTEGSCIAIRASKTGTLPEKSSPSSEDTHKSQESTAQGKCYKASQIVNVMGQSPKTSAGHDVTIQESTSPTPATYMTASESTKLSRKPISATQDSTPMTTPVSNHRAGGGKYFFFARRKNWDHARNECSSLGGYLVEIETEAENIFLFDKLQNEFAAESGGWWTGAMYKLRKGAYIWSRTAMLLEDGYTNWGPGQPPSNIPKINRRTGIILKKDNNYFWETAGQGHKFFFICEQDIGTDY